MTEATRDPRVEEMAHEELYRVFRWALVSVMGPKRVSLTHHASGEPYVQIEGRDGFPGITIATLMDVLGPNLDLSIEPNGSIRVECPSWPTVPFS
jgi:hypothetical protein